MVTDWKPEARRLRAEGWKLIAIASQLGKSHTAVHRACNKKAADAHRISKALARKRKRAECLSQPRL